MIFYSIFSYIPHLFNPWGESHEKVQWQHTLLTFTRSFIKFQRMVSGIQMKRAMRFIKFQRMDSGIKMIRAKRLLLTYLLTVQPSQRISISWLKMSKIKLNLIIFSTNRINVRTAVRSLVNLYCMWQL